MAVGEGGQSGHVKNNSAQTSKIPAQSLALCSPLDLPPSETDSQNQRESAGVAAGQARPAAPG